MKIKSEFILRQIAGENVVVFLNPEFQDKIVTLNSTGAYLFSLLSEDRDREFLINSLLSEYEVDEETASCDVDKFLACLNSFGALE